MARIEAHERCDFCLRRGPCEAKVYKAKNRTLLTFPNGMKWLDGDLLWGACLDCATLIDAKDWERFINRCMDGLVLEGTTDNYAQKRQKVVLMIQMILGESLA